MDFNDTQPIYLQICRWVGEKIIQKKWLSDERILSVREIAAFLEVNPNTAMRAYETLQNQGIIYNRRGIGYFVSPDAPEQILNGLKKEFFEQELPRLFDKMSILGISVYDIENHYVTFKKDYDNENKQ